MKNRSKTILALLAAAALFSSLAGSPLSERPRPTLVVAAGRTAATLAPLAPETASTAPADALPLTATVAPEPTAAMRAAARARSAHQTADAAQRSAHARLQAYTQALQAAADSLALTVPTAAAQATQRAKKAGATQTPRITDTPAPVIHKVAGEQYVWIPTKGGKKYHDNASCSGMNGPRQVTVSDAAALGFKPCKRCY